MLWSRQAAFCYLFDALPLPRFWFAHKYIVLNYAAKPQSCGFTINYSYSLPAGTTLTGCNGSHTIQRKIFKGRHHRRSPCRAWWRYPPAWARGVFKAPSTSINENNQRPTLSATYPFRYWSVCQLPQSLIFETCVHFSFGKHPCFMCVCVCVCVFTQFSLAE